LGFIKKEKELLLETAYVGPTVVQRLEEIGIDNFKKLSQSSVTEITTIVAKVLGSSCWKNSPQSKRAIENAIKTAKANK